MKKKLLALLLCTAMVLNTGITAFAAEETTFVALGENLSAEQRATVLGLLDLTEEELQECEVAYITNSEEHEYLDEYLGASVIGTKSLSSVKITKAEEGSGIQVSTNNINYCTPDMYRNALITAGLEDVEVVVAGPINISGTAALIGVMKAYESITGEKMNEDAFEAATNELVVTGELSEVLGDSDKASDFVAYIKQLIIEQGLKSKEDIEAAIREAMKEFGIDLTDEQIKELTELLQKISKLDIDVDALLSQAKGIYDKLKDMGVEFDAEVAKGFFEKYFSKIIDWIKGLLENK